MGCGKSTAAKGLASRGFQLSDSDAYIRAEVFTQNEVRDAIARQFGPEMIGPKGEIDRERLAAKVFADDGALRWLEELTHPRLFAHWRTLLTEQPAARWVFEVPLLFEKQLENWFDFIVCVTCAPAQQLTRLEQRGLTRALAAQRISKQLPLARKIERSDFVLLNDGSPEFLQKQIDRLVDALPVAS
jgi:dephospho-CoA kinase